MAAGIGPDRALGAAASAIRHHYDVADGFYRLWLDPSMTYSCALWAEVGESLEEAQLRKTDYHLAQARVAAGSRVLDVGCGWGGLLRRATETNGARGAVGLTLSRHQAEWIRGRGWAGCEVREESWSDHSPEERYDAVVSVGAFEHFARVGLPPAQRVAGYRPFFERCAGWLGPGGVLSLQTIVTGGGQLDPRALADAGFLAREIFPESGIPTMTDIRLASKGLFETVQLRLDGAHYARTCAVWRERLADAREAAVAVAGEATVRRYERYLDACVRLFEREQADLARLTLRATATGA
ncbi:class I SAM-dependent methyltransferase [Streptomyces sp. NPDC059564]|uniref:class I SAM-dependent methyltransferase n=1 Tax=Streptomyces sp. NPDC059564 TaxID=3346865 RepID=UPI00369B0177